MIFFLAVCGGEVMVTDEQGHLESPNFPDDYLPNKECVWKLTAPEGYQVGLKFNVFEVGIYIYNNIFFWFLISLKLIIFIRVLVARTVSNYCLNRHEKFQLFFQPKP